MINLGIILCKASAMRQTTNCMEECQLIGEGEAASWRREGGCGRERRSGVEYEVPFQTELLDPPSLKATPSINNHNMIRYVY